jgi:hypothetical protein
MRNDPRRNSVNSTAASGTVVFEVDNTLSHSGAMISKATSSSETPTFSSILGNVLREALNMAFVHWLTNASRSTGGFVKFLDDHADLPVLLGNDGNPVALFEFIEAIDGVVDYEALREELPTLSYAQINGAISFLRKVAQFNTNGVDIDDLEDQETANDPDLIEAMKKAIADQETSRVLNHSERNR